MTYSKSTLRYQGLALVELMISLALSAVLMLGVMRIFADTAANSASENALAQVHDSGRIAMELLKEEIRMAGYQGPAPGRLPSEENSALDLSQSSVVITPNANAKNSDQLTIFRAFETNMPLDLSDLNVGSSVVRVLDFQNSSEGNKLSLDRPICYSAADVFLVTDGTSVASFNFQEAAPCNGNATSSNQHITTIGDSSKKVSRSNFALPDDCRSNNLVACPVLYELGVGGGTTYRIMNGSLQRNGNDMVAGVENFQVLLGIESSNGNTRYRQACTPNEIANGNCNVSHIRLSIVVASDANVKPANAADTFSILNEQPADRVYQSPADRRIRRVFETTIELRNRR